MTAARGAAIFRNPTLAASCRTLARAVLAWLLAGLLAGPAVALKPIGITGEQDRLEITSLGEVFEGVGDQLQVETAPSSDGTTGRMGVRASTPGTNPNWLVFALTNMSEKTIEMWLTADRYNVVGSGIMWPDLDARRIETVKHSSGFVPERIKSDRADIFRLTIERGQTITYVAELSSERFPRLYLWKPIDFEQRQRDRQLFNGIMLGITGLLAVFLTAVFAANHKAIFPSAALVSWCVLALLCVDFGFWHKLFQMRPEDNAQYRAAAEAALAASLVMFLSTFLRVNLWHGFVRMLFVVWIAAQLVIVATSALDPRLATSVARMSFGMIGLVGAAVVLFFAARGLDRALALLPTWILFLVWLFGAAATLSGQLAGEAAISGLVAGLVLILVLIGFTVTQFAFRSDEPSYSSSPSQQQLRLAAIDQAGVSVWEWSAKRDEIKLDAEIEAALGLHAGELPTQVKDFAAHLHPADRERFLINMDAIKEQQGGSVRIELRMRHADSSYRWFEIEGASVAGVDRRQLRCVGLIRDVTDQKRAQERLMHDAVHDSLTALPNRELFLDRLHITMQRAKTDASARAAVFFIDIDKFRSVNSSFGLIVGDSILLTIARRLQRNVVLPDTLARVGGDQFAIFLTGRQDPRELAGFAEQLRLALRSQIHIAGQEIVLTGAIGIALDDGKQADAHDLLREAEVAMFRAKRAGSDRIEIFRPEMRAEKDARVEVESDLRRAIDARQLHLLYQPIVSLSSEELIGFEALVRWQHPRHGLLSPADFLPIAEESDLIVQLGSYVLGQATADIARWQKELPRPDNPLFVSVNVSSRQLIKPDLVQEIRNVLRRAMIPSESLRLEITESLVMENPEQASHVLDLVKELGVGLALDDFGTGYSSLAYLNRFPFDTIKIDKALVQSGTDGGNGAIIVRSIVALANELGKGLVAEGIETPEDAAFLRSIGCQAAQGFHYGEPMPEGDVGRLLRLIRKADRRMRRRGLVRGVDKKKADAATVLVGMPGTGDDRPADGQADSAMPTPVRPAAADPRPPQPPYQPQPPGNGMNGQPNGQFRPHGAPAGGPAGGSPGGTPSGYGAPPGGAQSPQVRPVSPSPVQMPHATVPTTRPVNWPIPAPAPSPIAVRPPMPREVPAPQAWPRPAPAQPSLPHQQTQSLQPTQPPGPAPTETYAAPQIPLPVATRPVALPEHVAAVEVAVTPTPPAMTTIERIIANSGSAPLPPDAAPAATPPAATPPAAAEPAAPKRRLPRKANLDSLPPGIAERLAKLAGKSRPAADAATGETGAPPVQVIPGKTAAE